ncbi:MAG: aspartyl protease family protein [Candidatus Edwardsbacteria bacterium]
MGRVIKKIRVENLEDVLRAERGELSFGQIRAVEIDALVDTGATSLCLPAKIIADLGLSFLGVRTAITADGPKENRVFRGAQLTILNRTCTGDVMELSDNLPALIGYVPLEVLDLKVDPKEGTIIPNPEHGDKIVLDLFLYFVVGSIVEA